MDGTVTKTVGKLYSAVTNTSSLKKAAQSVTDTVLGFPTSVENMFEYPTVCSPTRALTSMHDLLLHMTHTHAIALPVRS